MGPINVNGATNAFILIIKHLIKNILSAAKRENVHKIATYMYQWRLPISLHVANSLDPDPTLQNVGPDLDQIV